MKRKQLKKLILNLAESIAALYEDEETGKNKDFEEKSINKIKENSNKEKPEDKEQVDEAGKIWFQIIEEIDGEEETLEEKYNDEKSAREAAKELQLDYLENVLEYTYGRDELTYDTDPPFPIYLLYAGDNDTGGKNKPLAKWIIVNNHGEEIGEEIKAESNKIQETEQVDEAEKIDKEKLYDEVLEDGRLDDYIFNVLNVPENDTKTFSEKQKEYGDYIVSLMVNDKLSLDEAVKHVTSKNWETYREEILDRAMKDGFDTDVAEQIADAVASPVSGITYEEYTIDADIKNTVESMISEKESEEEEQVEEARREKDSGFQLNTYVKGKGIDNAWWVTVSGGGDTSSLKPENCWLYPGKKVKPGTTKLWKRGQVRGLGVTITWPEYCFAIKNNDEIAIQKIVDLGLPLDLDKYFRELGTNYEDYFIDGVPEPLTK